MTFESVAAEQALQRQAADLVTAYLGHAQADEKPLAVEVATQAPLVDPLTGEDLSIPLVGIIDLIVGSPDGVVIADFKTSARSSEPLEIFHELQLNSYSYRFRHRHRWRPGLQCSAAVAGTRNHRPPEDALVIVENDPRHGCVRSSAANPGRYRRDDACGNPRFPGPPWQTRPGKRPRHRPHRVPRGPARNPPAGRRAAPA